MRKNCRATRFAALTLCVMVSLLLKPARAAETADTPFTVDSWGTDEGLPQSSVISMIQTKDGYLWLGTLNGLVRFDGTRFTVFDQNSTPGLNSDRIVFLFEDSHTNLWVGTDAGGVALIKNGQVQNFTVGGSGHGGRITSACEDSSGSVWFYTADAHLGRYQNGKIEILHFNFNPQAVCRQVIAEKSGVLWVGEDWGMFSFQPGNFHPPAMPIDQSIRAESKLDHILASARGGTWRFINGHIQKWGATTLEKDLGPYPWTNVNVFVTSAVEDKDGNLIIGALNAGVFWYDANGGYQHISTAEGLSHSGVLSVYLDRSENLWVGTDGGGLNRLKKKIFHAAQGVRSEVVQSIAEDAAGGLWVAFNGHGLSYWLTNSVTDFDLGVNHNPWTVLVDHQQQVWVGTRDEGLFIFETNYFKPVPMPGILRGQIFALLEDRGGRLWAGTQNGLGRWDGKNWKIFTRRDGLSENAVRAIAEDAAGNLWAGTESQGLNRFQAEKFVPPPKDENTPPAMDISSLCADRDGSLWVGTFGHGLAKWRNGQWTHYYKRDGLASSSISFVSDDGAGDLWVGSNLGLMRINKKSLNDFAAKTTDFISCRTYGKADGLPTRECSTGSQPAVCATSDGRLWFPTTKGLASVNPAGLKPNTQPPLVLIESVRVEGVEQRTNLLNSAWQQAITIPPGFERLEIHYTGLNFSAPNAVRFRYRLEPEGRSTAWTDADDARVAYYNPSQLSPGRYHFHVVAANEDGVSSEAGGTLEVVVQPQFWETGWFLAAAIAVFLGVVVGVVRFISTQKLRREVQLLKQQEALEKERSRIARDLHDHLGANLTQVALLGELAEADRNSPEEVASHAQQISQTARETTHSLDEIVWAVNPANDTLEGLFNYACKYVQEYAGLAGLRYRVAAPVKLPAAAIPPEVRHNVFLTFKEAVNNVVKHAQASEVWVRLHLQPEGFILEIDDNGRGMENFDAVAAQSRNGLKNMRKRMADIHGEFSISPGTSGGTRVRLTVPLSKPVV